MDEARIKLFLTSVEHVETQYHQQKQYFIEAAHRVIELLDADGIFKHSKRRKISHNKQVHADHSEFEKENVFASSASIKRQTKGGKPTDVAPIANTANLEDSGGKCKGKEDQNPAAKSLDNSGEILRSAEDPNGRNKNKRPKKVIAKDVRDDTTQGGGLATRMTRSRARQVGNGSVTDPLIVYEDKPPARRTRRKDLVNSKQADQGSEIHEPSPRILQKCSSIKEEQIVSPCIPPEDVRHSGSEKDLSNSKEADQVGNGSVTKRLIVYEDKPPARRTRRKDLVNSKQADQGSEIHEPSPRILQKCSSIKEEQIVSPCIPPEDVRHSGSEKNLSNSKEADQVGNGSVTERLIVYEDKPPARRTRRKDLVNNKQADQGSEIHEPSPRILQKCSSIKEEQIVSPCIPPKDVRHSGSEKDLSNSKEADQASEPSPRVIKTCSSIKKEPIVSPWHHQNPEGSPYIPAEDVRHLSSVSEKVSDHGPEEIIPSTSLQRDAPQAEEQHHENPEGSPCIPAEGVRHFSSVSEKVDGYCPEEGIPSTSSYRDAPQGERRYCQDPEVEETDARVLIDLNIPAGFYHEDGMENVVIPNEYWQHTSGKGSDGQAKSNEQNGEGRANTPVQSAELKTECEIGKQVVVYIGNQHTSGKGSDDQAKSNEQNEEGRSNTPVQSAELKTECEIGKQVVVYIGNQHLFSAGGRSSSIGVPLEVHHNEGTEKFKFEKDPMSPQNIEDEGPCGVFSPVEGKLHDSIRRSYSSQFEKDPMSPRNIEDGPCGVFSPVEGKLYDSIRRSYGSQFEKDPMSPQNIEDEGPCGVSSPVEGKLYDSIRRSYGSQVAAGEQTEEPTSGRRSGSIEGHHYARGEGTCKSVFGKHQISQQTIEDEGICVEAFRFSDERIASVDGNECSIGYCLSQENKLRMTSVSSARNMHSCDRRFSDCNSSTRRERNHLLGPSNAVSGIHLEALLPNEEPVGVVCIAEEKENIPMELSYDDHTPRKMLSFSTDNTFGVSNSTVQKTCKPVTKASNLVGNMQSFLSLVIQQQAAAACPGKREVKVKALEAAEAAKRQEEKREQERKARLESLKQAKERNLQQQNKHEQRIENKSISDVHGKPLAGSSISNSSLHLRQKRTVEVKHQAEHEKTKKLEEEQKKREEEWKRKEMEFAAKKRKKEETERRGREEKQEAKRRKLEDVHKLRRLQEEKQRAEFEERELRRKALEESEREKRAFEEEMKRQRRLEKEREIERRRKDEQDAKDAWLALKEAERKRKEENFQRLKLIEKEKGRAEKVSSMCEMITTAGTFQWEAQAKPNSGKDKLRAATFGHGDKEGRTTSLSSQAGLGPALRVLMKNHVNSPYAVNASEARNSAAIAAELQAFSSITQMAGPIIAASQANGDSKIGKSLGTPALHPLVRGVSSGAMGQGYCARPNVGQVEDLVTRSIIANKPCTSLGTPALHSAVRGVGPGVAGHGYCASPCTEQEDVGPQTYEISPYKSSSDEEDEDDEEIPRKPIPLWARKDELLKQLLRQAHMDPDEIFASAKTCSLHEVFGTKGSKRKQDFSRRSASGDWGCDIASYKEVIQYKQSMGYLHQ